MDYIRVCKGLSDKGQLIPVIGNDLSGIYKKLNKNQDAYASVFFFNNDHYKTFQKTGTIAGITDVTSNKLCWDFDASDVDVARIDATELVYRLQKEGYTEDNIRIFFSGNKGFEVSVELENERVTPNEMKNICIGLAEGLATADPVIYNATRILRLPLTKHQKSGLYKFPLGIADLESLSAKEIAEAATQELQYESIKEAWQPVKLSVKLKELKDKAPEIRIKESAVLTMDLTTIDWDKKPRELTYEKYLISLGYFENGMRSEALMILASTLKNLGYNETQTYYACKAAADLQSKRLNDEKFPKAEIYKNIIEQVYGEHWKGGSYSVKDNILLQQLSAMIPSHVRMKGEEDGVVNIDEGFNSFVSYAKDIDKNTIQFGIPELDKLLTMQTGRLYGILAGPGVGKTTFGTAVINNTSKGGEKSIFFSYDMSGPDMVQKMIQKHSRLSSTAIYDAFRENDVAKLDKFKLMLKDNYSNVTFVFKTGQSIEEMKRTITEREKQLGAPIRLVVVDYLELVQSKFSDPTQASMEAIQGLREIAVGMNKAVIVMLQPSKMATSIDEPITTYTGAKGSSSIAQAVTAMLTLHRPGYSSRTPENDKFIGIDCVKNRSGRLFSLDLHFDGASGNIRGLEGIEAADLADLRKAKSDSKKADEDLF